MKLFRVSFLLIAVMLMMSSSSCKEEKYPDLGDGIFAEIVTNKGTMVAKLTPSKTPVTVANFVALAEGVHPEVADKFKGKPFYNGLTFHRVMNDFMIQGGDPEARGTGSPGYRFGDEFHEELKHDKPGVLSMANPGPNSNGSQFFITEKPTPWLDNRHSVFGELVLGKEVHDSISEVAVDASDKPLETIRIEQVNIIRQGFDARKYDALKTWETELPLLEEKQKQLEEEARLKAEEERRINEEKGLKASAEMLPILEDYKSKTQTSSSGLQYYFLTQGNGERPKQGQAASIIYEGYFTDGRLFDSNRKETEEKYGMLNPLKERRGLYGPIRMVISPDAALVQGFKEALANMRVGDKVFAYIPSHLAYGEAGRPPVIGPNTDLVFILEMVEILE